MKSVLLAASAVTFALAAAPAHAAIVSFDDFSVSQGPITDTSVNGVRAQTAFLDIVAGPDLFRRRLTADLLARIPPGGSTTRVASGVLDIVHGAGEKGENRVIYRDGAYINGLLAPLAPISNLAFFLKIVQSDANPATLDILLDGVNIGSRVIPANSFNLNFLVPISPSTDFSVGLLEFVFNGEPGYDLSFDTFGFLVNVPAPAGVALFGLGLLALGLRRRS
jgi:hypothetical protein